MMIDTQFKLSEEKKDTPNFLNQRQFNMNEEKYGEDSIFTFGEETLNNSTSLSNSCSILDSRPPIFDFGEISILKERSPHDTPKMSQIKEIEEISFLKTKKKNIEPLSNFVLEPKKLILDVDYQSPHYDWLSAVSNVFALEFESVNRLFNRVNNDKLQLIKILYVEKLRLKLLKDALN